VGGWVDLGVIRFFTLLLFIGLAFWGCEEDIPAYIDCKWFANAGWQEGDNNCNNYRQYTLGDTANGFVYYVERVNNYLELGILWKESSAILKSFTK